MIPVIPTPQQVMSEWKEFLSLVKDADSYLEVGTDGGGTLYEVLHTLKNARVASIDLPNGPYSSNSPIPSEEELQSWKGTNTLTVIRGDSKTVELPTPFFHQVVFIDGDHSYEGVKSDFDRFDGEIVAFHDILSDNTGVPKFWAELKAKYKHQEIIANPLQGFAGIGIIWKLHAKTRRR